MNKQSFFLTLLSVMLLFQCTQTELPDNNEEVKTSVECTENPLPCDLAKTVNSFGFEVFQKLHEAKAEENSFLSPLSISTALSMVLNGADGDTKTAIQSVLNVKDWQLDEINKAYLALLMQLPDLDEEVKLQIANSIWYKEGFEVLPEFLDANSDFYSSEIAELNFLKPEAVNTINSWVEEKTEGLIDEILKEIPSDAVMYLINAIYFKGNWTNAFDPEWTYDAQFTLNNGEQEEVEMMTLGKKELAYFENEQMQAVTLPYGDSVFAMSIYLPKSESDLSEVISTLSQDNWENWNTNYETTEVLFSMPKFELAYEKKLNSVLEDLGMGVAFSSKADFSKISKAARLKISEVRHKSFITVDEKGTEAAAVTIIGVETTSVPSYPIMEVNRPFVFVIRDMKTNSALFIGKVNNPNED